jgi:hypothetical protein
MNTAVEGKRTRRPTTSPTNTPPRVHEFRAIQFACVLALVAQGLAVNTATAQSNGGAQSFSSLKGEPPKTLSASLETEFNTMLAACGVQSITDISIADRFLRRARPSSVPPDLQAEFSSDSQRSVVSVTGTSSYEIWRYVFDADTLRINAYDQLNQQRRLATGPFGAIRLPQPTAGGRTVAFNQSCGSLVDAAFSAGLNVSVVAVQAALKSEYSHKRSLVLIRGTFESPLTHGLSVDATPDEARLALLTVHQFYATNAGNARFTSTRPKFIASYEGVALVQLGEINSNVAASSSVTASGNWLMASADGSVKVSTQYDRAISSQEYGTLLFVDGRPGCGATGCIAFDTLPSREDIARRLSAMVIQAAPPAERQFVVSGGSSPVTLLASFGGMPTRLCDLTRWIVQPAVPPAQQVMLRDLNPGKEPNTCDARFQAPARAATDDTPLMLSFAMIPTAGGALAATPRLAFASTVNPTLHPVAIVADYRKFATPEDAAGVTTSHGWDIPVTFYDKDAPVDFGNLPSVSSTSMTCASHGTQAIGRATVKRSEDRGYAFHVSRLFLTGEEIRPGPGVEACDVTIQFSVPLLPPVLPAGRTGAVLQSAGTAIRSVTTQVLLPTIGQKVVVPSVIVPAVVLPPAAAAPAPLTGATTPALNPPLRDR